MRAEPTYVSPIPEGTDIEEAHMGARLQRLPMTPQGEVIAGVMQARRPDGRPKYKRNVVEVGRRATKTTSIQNVYLGRCLNRPGWQVVSTAQDGTRASQFMRELMDRIVDHANEILEERNDELAAAYDGDGDPPEISLKEALAQLGIRQLYYSQQREYIKFTNGSKWRVAKPEASGLRGGAADDIWVDEGGELDPETSPALLAGALPMMDTRPSAQMMISGTPGPARAGAFWEWLELARSDPERYGIADWCAGDFADPHDEDVWWAHHPGLACGLTTIETLRERHDELPIDKFMMEYLCVWPPDSKVTALNLQNYKATSFVPWGAPPEHQWAIGYDVEPDGSEAAVAVAWLDDAGDPWVQIMRHRLGGSAWLDDYLARALVKHPKVRIGYDSIGQNIAVAQQLARRPRVRPTSLKALSLKEVGAATATISQANDRLALRHAEHPALDAAVKNAAWRQAGDTRLFARKGGGIAPLMATTHALAVVATLPQRTTGGGSLPRTRTL